jgi:hypothetical protein
MTFKNVDDEIAQRPVLMQCHPTEFGAEFPRQSDARWRDLDWLRLMVVHGV